MRNSMLGIISFEFFKSIVTNDDHVVSLLFFFFIQKNITTVTCPVLCSGRGQYLSGECVCNSGWKGKECHIREDECEVPNCNGHGDCIDGTCHCFAGYKGDHCQNGLYAC